MLLKTNANKINSKIEVFSGYLKNKPLLFSIGLTFLILFFIWSQFSAFYDSNDDIAMQMIASGKGYTAEPQYTLVFTNIIIGFILQKFYLSFPDISFYPLYLLAVMAISAWYLIFLFIDQKKILLVLPIIIYFVFLLTIKLQFTIVAAFTGACGIAGVIHMNYTETPVKHELMKYLVAIILIWISSLIRFQSLLMIILIAIPSVFYLFLMKRKMLLYKNWKFILTVSVGVFIFFIINYTFYANNEDWAIYKNIQTSRSGIIDFGKSDLSDSVLANIGLNRIEYKLINEWYSIEPVCSNDQIHELSLAKKKQASHISINENILVLIDYLMKLLFLNTNVIFMSLILSILFLNIKKRYLYLINILWLLLIFLFLEIYLKISFRVVISGIVALIIFTFCFIEGRSFLLKTKIRALNFFVMFFIVLLCYVSIKISSNRIDYAKFNEIEPKINSMNLFKQPILLWGGGSSLLTRIPVLEIEKNIAGFRFIPIGWLSHSPVFRNILKFNNINSTNEFFEKDSRILIISKEGAMSTLKSYFEIKNIKADIETQLIFENDIQLYHIKIK